MSSLLPAVVVVVAVGGRFLVHVVVHRTRCNVSLRNVREAKEESQVCGLRRPAARLQSIVKSPRWTATDIHLVCIPLQDKIVVIIGPCSIHNTAEALEYAALLKEEAKNLPELVVIMRSYFESKATSHRV